LLRRQRRHAARRDASAARSHVPAAQLSTPPAPLPPLPALTGSGSAAASRCRR
jgi:hypothetical protein